MEALPAGFGNTCLHRQHCPSLPPDLGPAVIPPNPLAGETPGIPSLRIVHIPGKQNTAADALSRHPTLMAPLIGGQPTSSIELHALHESSTMPPTDPLLPGQAHSISSTLRDICQCPAVFSLETPVNNVSKITGVTQPPLDMQNTLAWLPTFRQLTPFPHSFPTLLGECNLLADQLWPSQLPISMLASSPDALHLPVRDGNNLTQVPPISENYSSEAHAVHVCNVTNDIAIASPLFADS